MASTLQLYKSLAIETNFSPPISARFTFIARRLQTFSLLYELSKETPFCRALFLIQERLWFLYARNPSTRQRAQEWSHKLSRIIQDETSIYSDQRTVLIELKNLVDHAYQIARIRYDVPLGEPVTRASKLIEACVSLRDSLQPTEHFIFVREILASIHGWAKAFSDISSQLFSALQEDTSIVLDLWFTKLLRAQIEHQLVERLTESYVTITESSLISSKATSKEEEKNPADAINTQVQAAQEKCVLWKAFGMKNWFCGKHFVWKNGFVDG